MGLSRDARVGMTSLLVLIALAYAVSYLTSVQHTKNYGTPYHIIFNRVEGIEEGTNVVYNGRVVGLVRKLEVTHDPYERCDVTISIKSSNVKLTRESSCIIDSPLWGAKWISIQYRPGEEIPRGGAMFGETYISFNTKLQFWVVGLNQLHDTIAYYKQQLGSGDKARESVKRQIRYWNFMAFDLRVQANKFNQFAGLINQQLNKAMDRVNQRIAAFHAQGDMAIGRMRLWAHGMTSVALQKSAMAHAMVNQLGLKLIAMQSAVSGMKVYLTSGENFFATMISSARKRVQEAQDMVSALRFISRNPKFADQFRTLAANMRQKAAQMRQMVESIQKRTAPRVRGKTPKIPAVQESTGSQGPPAPGIVQPPLPRQTPAPAVPSPLPTASSAP